LTRSRIAAWLGLVSEPALVRSGYAHALGVIPLSVSSSGEAGIRASNTFIFDSLDFEGEGRSESLADKEQRLRLAEAAGHIGTWEWNPEDESPALSSELGLIFGIAIDDPDRGRKWASHVWPEDWPKVQSLMQQGTQTGEMEFEYRYLHPELGMRWLYCKGRRFHGQSRLFGVVQDISARKDAEEASHRLAAIVESSDDAIISKDLSGTVTSWNLGAERMFGFTAREMIGRPITTIIPPELRSDEIRILAAVTRGERIQHFETTRVKKNGDRIEVSLTVSPVKDEAGRIVGAAKIARDITRQKEAEKALLVTERLAAVGRLAATVAHEINNPLEAITNLIFLAKNAAVSSEVVSFLRTAEEQLAFVAHLSRQTLGFYRDTNGSQRLKPAAVIESALVIFSARARNRSIRLQSEVREGLEFSTVPGEIGQVIANLVSNSIDAIHGCGQVTIRVSSARRWSRQGQPGIRFTVADNGSGISAAALARVFEPFFTTKRDVGTGLGLWICKNIIQSHEGTIRARSSTEPGKSWTVFSVFLPLNAPTNIPNYQREPPEGLLRRIA
jgi:PAS domain S-box-containing protein